MKKLLILCTLVPLFSMSQVNLQWETRYTGSGNNIDKAADMVIDASGNIYVTGTSYSSTTGFDIVTIKYDNTGSQLWMATYNGPGSGLDEARAIEIDGSGNVYVTGYAYQGASDWRVATIKYDANGNQMWANLYNQSNDFDQGRDLAVDGSGNVYVTGSVVNAGNTNYITIKYNTGGTQQWAQQYNGTASALDEGFGVALDGAGNVYVVGHSSGTGTDLDITLVKYNNSGTFQWDNRYDNNADFETPTDIIIDGTNIYVCGWTYFNALQDANFITMKYNDGGTRLWDDQVNGPASDADQANAITVDSNGEVIVTGRSVGNSSAEDFLTIKYDANGNELWRDRWTGSGSFYDEPEDVTTDASNNIYITGYSYSSGSNNDFATLKYDPSGNMEWLTLYDGPAGNSDQGLAMAIDPLENIYVTGGSVGSSTGEDYSTLKYCQLTTDAGANDTICVGNSVQLNVTGASNFTWTSIAGDPINVGSNFSCNPCNNPVATPSQTTTYVVSSTNANGCTDYDTVSIVVNPLPGPTIFTDGPSDFCYGDDTVALYTDVNVLNWSTGETTDTIMVDTTGTYTVTVIDSMGCENSTNINITSYLSPVIDAGTPDSLCLGDSTQLMASGGTSYTWWSDSTLSDSSIMNPIATPTIDQYYFVTGTDVNGCTNYDSVEIVVWPLPTPPNITRLHPQLISSYSTGNQWYLNGSPLAGETSQTLTYSQNGDYLVSYTDANGCTSFSDTMSIQDISVGEVGRKLGLNLFPNPTGGQLTLDITAVDALNVNLDVLDATGRVVLNDSGIHLASGVTKRMTINLSEVEKGFYFVRIQGGDASITKRVIVR